MSKKDKLADEDIISTLQRLCFGDPNPVLVGELDRNTLQRSFDSNHDLNLRSLEPVWDMRIESISHNDAPPDIMSGAILYVARRDKFAERCGNPKSESLPPQSDLLNSDRFLRVFGHWMDGHALTPPLMYQSESEMISKVDGFHRIVMALLSETPLIPFYCRDQLRFEGFTLASDDQLRDGSWSPIARGHATFFDKMG